MTGRGTSTRPRFDMARAYEALAFDYSQYELPQRRPMLLHKLEACIEPLPTPPAQLIVDRTATTLHLAMAGSLILAAVLGLILAPQLWWLQIPTAGLGSYALYRHLTAPHHRKERP